MPHFFDLPREVRDLIYGQYVISDGGYVLDFESNTLKCANGDNIDLAFMLTCKAVANELRTVPFSTNTLNFSTICSEECRITAGRFDDLVAQLHDQLGEKFFSIYPDNLSVPDDVWRELVQDHPKFAPYIERIKGRTTLWVPNDEGKLRLRDAYRNVSPAGSCGETPSTFRQFSRAALCTIVAHKDRFSREQFEDFQTGMFVVGENVKKYGGPPPVNLEALVEVNPDPWEVPTSKRVEEMAGRIKNDDRELKRKRLRDLDQVLFGPRMLDTSLIKYHYSAAATAIRFFRSVSKDTRLGIRNVLLKEERLAVAFPECHGLGLIPFCLENPQLRVERRVNMWRAVFPTTLMDLHERRLLYKPTDRTFLQPMYVSSQVAIWVQEALELEHAGMPQGSFTLVFDGDSSCSEIFKDIVQRDAAWQQAIDICLDRSILPPLRWDVRRRDARHEKRGRREDRTEVFRESDNAWYVREGFPQAINDIVAGKSIVKCNFWVGDVWDVERLAEENKQWSMQQWKTAWYDQLTTRHFEPDPPSPGWVQLLCDDTFETGLPSTE
ncbi:hypothetical protein CGCS363_v012703 [Colletotrichum siamense]|uniref:uncharacterized protein n=1 Tax=Colletotrichum siamense TaxID=690259 RepID=UPI0018724E1F|nr:uncharacterized protein CGCS363_v012703 [Colletotrichum siamense]KAF5490049.1 hypothetical protein CGCS363_v012703 [Colletotrichum siamense]